MQYKQISSELIDRVLELTEEDFPEKNKFHSTTILPNLFLLKSTRPTNLEATLYQPVVSLILQGEKEITLGERHLRVGAGESLVVSHELPVVSCITKATEQKPYLAIVLSLDLAILRSLYDQVSGISPKQDKNNSIDFDYADPDLLNALDRYVALAKKPEEQKVMAPLIQKEIHFRLLMASQGGMLRQLIWHDSQASRISRAMQQIRENFRDPIAIPDLAKGIGMSSSSFHQHFKLITSTTPLQYLKDLRLLEARRLLQSGASPINHIAFEVGYESPTQFSREYARKFGASPRNDPTLTV